MEFIEFWVAGEARLRFYLFPHFALNVTIP